MKIRDPVAFVTEANIKFEIITPESAKEPRLWVVHQPSLGLALQPGSIEVGLRRSEMKKFTYDTGEIRLTPRLQKWFRVDDLYFLYITISDTALAEAWEGTNGEVELRGADNVLDARVSGLAATLNAERIAGFPNGRLFLDSIEQALAIALVHGFSVRDRAMRTYLGGLGPARLRRVKEFIDAKMEDELTLSDMAQSVGLSASHFSEMFRKSTGETAHECVLRCRTERAKEILRKAELRVLDVAVACGFKTQQHFARVFRQLCGASPSEYRREFLG
jgi:AraC family transcriptional regulator